VSIISAEKNVRPIHKIKSVDSGNVKEDFQEMVLKKESAPTPWAEKSGGV
jgi:hypothetical protein